MNRKTIYPIIVLIIAGIVYSISQNKEEGKEVTISNKIKNMELDPSIKKTTIAFYNVENLFDIYDDPHTYDEDFTPTGEQRWDMERYNDKLTKIGEMMTTIEPGQFPAIMGFSEVENYDVMKDLIHSDALKNAGYEIIHQDNHDGRGIDVAAIYRPTAFQVSSYTYYPVVLPGKDKATTRDILEIKGQFNNGEQAVVYFLHWSSRRAGTKETEPKRIAAAKILRDKIDRVLIEKADANIFILGDFNDEPSDLSVQKYLMKNDFSNLSQQFEYTKNGTVNHQGDWLVFDQIIVSNAAMRNPVFKLTEKSARIHKTNQNTFTHKDGNQVPSRTYGGDKYYGGYSDHYPVYIRVKLNKK